MRKLDEPLNANERFLYGIAIRLEVLIEMFSSFLEEYAKDNNIASTSNQVETIDVDNLVEDVDYSTLTKSELVELLKENNIDCNERMLKSELLELTKLL